MTNIQKYDTWIRSPYYHLNNEEESCRWSNKYNITIHVFGLKEQTCKCGEFTIKLINDKKETKGGWKGQTTRKFKNGRLTK